MSSVMFDCANCGVIDVIHTQRSQSYQLSEDGLWLEITVTGRCNLCETEIVSSKLYPFERFANDDRFKHLKPKKRGNK